MGLGKATNGPVVLLLASWRWISTARLAMALAELGCTVDLVSPANHPAGATGAVRTRYRYDPLRPARSLRSAFAAARPATVIAADEVMVQHLEDLWWTAEAAKTAENAALQQLIERSAGGSAVLEASRSRLTLLEMARQQGIATPLTVSVADAGELQEALRQVGLPAVLKADATSGGRGVKIVKSAIAAKEAWKTLHEPPSLPRAMVRGLMRKEWNYLHISARRRTRDVTAQQFVSGPERTGMVACREGEVLASVCMEVVRTWCVRGPASVVRVVQDETMAAAMRDIARQLGVSGFCGFDFIVDNGRALLIEMNPRPTQVVHLPLGAGHDLVAAYIRGVVGLEDVRDRAAATTGDLVALFPQELQRDPASEFVEKGFHDVPWTAPGLVKRALAGSPHVVLKDRRRSSRGSSQASIESRRKARLMPIKEHRTV